MRCPVDLVDRRQCAIVAVLCGKLQKLWKWHRSSAFHEESDQRSTLVIEGIQRCGTRCIGQSKQAERIECTAAGFRAEKRQTALLLLGSRLRQHSHALIGPVRKLSAGETVSHHNVRQFVWQGIERPMVGIPSDIDPSLDNAFPIERDRRAANRLTDTTAKSELVRRQR